ncbi:Cdc6/Cdc18 family protein [Haladaptatus sp. ZSTT2]|uniref:Cdc6/Cdc18 family protein n=1 Tax=Haladaptatus sp. ZSTT2 TaxID=3120515 RepID=UPI00300EC748
MIRDARVLQDDFLPQEVQHREAEVTQLSTTLAALTRDEIPETAFLSGPSGVGKTCIAKFTVDRLREELIDVNHQYINCWEDYNRYRTLYRILEGIGQTLDVHRQSTPLDELLERVRSYDGPPYVVILDEVDQLEDTSVLYDLYNTPRIHMVLIANEEDDLFAELEERVRSRLLSSVRIRFERYHLEELVTILEDRAQWGLSEGAIGKQQLALIADAAAGDARVAIGILRNAARRAQQENADTITFEMVHESVPRGKAEVKRKAVDKLHPHQHALYEILRDEGELSPGDLYERYTEKVENPKTKRTVRNYLTKMDHYGLVIAEGTNRGRTYRPQ